MADENTDKKGNGEISQPSQNKQLLIWRILAIVCFIVVICMAIAIGVIVHQVQKKNDPSSTSAAIQGVPACLQGTTSKPRDFENPDIFDDLSTDELVIAQQYLNRKLGFTSFDDAVQRKNLKLGYIYAIDLHVPSKDDALSYLDDGHTKPAREALAIVYRGDLDPPQIQEYIVGPLPEPRWHREFVNPSYRKRPIPYNARMPDSLEYNLLYNIISKTTGEVHNILIDLYGASYHNCSASDEGAQCLLFVGFAPRGIESGERKTLFGAFINGEGVYIRPTGFYLIINHEGLNPSTWSVERIISNNKQFHTIDRFTSAYRRGILLKLDKSDSRYYSYKRRGPSMPDKPQMGPQFFEPEGKRFKVTGRHVEYMGWSFNFRSRWHAGLQLFNIKFRGERIAYELGLQENLVMYSGYDILPITANYWDVSWGVGTQSHELVPGIDCPETALFFDMDYLLNSGKPVTNHNSVCVFELNGGIPLRRHYTTDDLMGGGFKYYSGVADYQLVVRQIASVWNYDYVFDYKFRLNGEIEVKASATGYPQATIYTNLEDSYGHKIHDTVSANIHLHAFHYKIDLDIAGRVNRYETLDVSVEDISHPWYRSRPNARKQQMKFDRLLKRTETEAAYKYNFETPKYCVVYNNEAFNKYGVKRGYRVKPVSMTKFLLPGATAAGQAASWANYQLAVTKYEDGERMSTSVYAQNDPFDPVLKFDEFIVDDDDIVDTDLVTWVTLATLHIPSSEDAPSTQTAHSTVQLFLYPFNYFDEDPSVGSTDSIFVEPDASTGKVKVERYGTPQFSNCLPKQWNNGTFVDPR